MLGVGKDCFFVPIFYHFIRRMAHILLIFICIYLTFSVRFWRTSSFSNDF